MKKLLFLAFAMMACLVAEAQQEPLAETQQGPRAKVDGGTVEGIDSSGVKIFRGIPFAAPPVGDLRWKAPQPVVAWRGVRSAKQFGNDPIQHSPAGDMLFEGAGQSEDCLYLNVWTPAKTMREKLPVLIYFNGGGLTAGSGSERRYQGLRLARRGIIVVTANYREGIFGFFSHPQLTREGGCNGNQGWMDQAAAIKWVKNNIAAFGGDPRHIVITGESAGSWSVCAQTVSPLSKDLIAGYMCSSGSIVSNASPKTLSEAEKIGEDWAEKHGYHTLADLRKVPAAELEKMAGGTFGGNTRCIDGIFLDEDPNKVIEGGRQAQVPALMGNNSCEFPVAAYTGGKPTMKKFAPAVSGIFGVDAQTVFDLYGIRSDADLTALRGYQLSSDMGIAYATWKWTDMVSRSSRHPVYRYVFCHARPDVAKNGVPGAVHASDIEYAMGNLSTDSLIAWQPADYAVSEIFQQVYVNFVKNLNPNSLGLPQWDAYNGGSGVPPVMYIDTKTEQRRLPDVEARYHKIDGYIQAKRHK